MVPTPTLQIGTSTVLGHGSVTFQSSGNLNRENIVGSRSTNNKDPPHNMNYEAPQMDYFNDFIPEQPFNVGSKANSHLLSGTNFNAHLQVTGGCYALYSLYVPIMMLHHFCSLTCLMIKHF